MRLLRALASAYSPRLPTVLTYMLQSVEYRPGPYLAWFWRTENFSHVMRRRRLDGTRAATTIVWCLRLGMALQLLAGAAILAAATRQDVPGGWQFGAALILAYPVLWAHLVVIPLWLGRFFIILPRERRLIRRGRVIFHDFEGVKIAVAGSYGKTSMKELLATVLREGKKVAATPANRNVAISHARFADGLKGDEDVLIIEYGEGRPGDVAQMADMSQPTHAVITGLAPAHLDRYADVAAAGTDIFSLASAVPAGDVYVNSESADVKPFLREQYQAYDRTGVADWRVHDATVSLAGTDFTMRHGKQELRLHSGLVGLHHVGPLAMAASLAMRLGLSEEQVIAGIAKTAPFEHRMQPYRLSGATVIDDTYNGTIEGMKAGTELLAALPAERKIYVTPGLVDQGTDSDSIHQRLGGYIAAAAPDMVVLMRNSATSAIRKGLTDADYAGRVHVEENPLAYYTNLKEYIASGDLVMLQNDWTDNYA